MKVVFDTNIFVVSALAIPGGRAEQALQRILDGGDELVISRQIVLEVLEVLARKFARDREELALVAVFLSEIGERVEPQERFELLSDEGDNRVLECAVAAGAEAIVTGDKDLLDLGHFRGIRMTTLRDYLKSVRW